MEMLHITSDLLRSIGIDGSEVSVFGAECPLGLQVDRDCVSLCQSVRLCQSIGASTHEVYYKLKLTGMVITAESVLCYVSGSVVMNMYMVGRGGRGLNREEYTAVCLGMAEETCEYHFDNTDPYKWEYCKDYAEVVFSDNKRRQYDDNNK